MDSMADGEDADDVYTVIPMAPEDAVFDPGLNITSTPPTQSTNKRSSRPPSMVDSGRVTNGASHNSAVPERSKPRASSKEGGKRKDGKSLFMYALYFYT